MKIALLTFLDVANFGANLQTVSTFNYLKNHGHDVEAINYKSYKTSIEKGLSLLKRRLLKQSLPIQDEGHKFFIHSEIINRSPILHTSNQVAQYIVKKDFDGVIIGSDAVAQHWPWLSTLRLGLHRPLWIEPLQRERRFPNPFWGKGFAGVIPTVMMSVSSQNSKYHTFSSATLNQMSHLLSLMKYISVRDACTREMMLCANPSLTIDVTPDPVFALNQNLGSKIPTGKAIREKFQLPEHYVLIGLRSQVFSRNQLQELNEAFLKQGKECVAFSIDGRYSYQHPFNYQIPLPLSPTEWFALIKYASAYIGSNMHPIVSSLTNAVPCFSIDNWGIVDFKGKKIGTKASSKTYDLLSQYNLTEYHSSINRGICDITPTIIADKISKFPVEDVRRISEKRLGHYNEMMDSILRCF